MNVKKLLIFTLCLLLLTTLLVSCKDDGNDKSADESKGESNADTTSGETGLLDGKTAEEILDIALEKFSAINNLTFEGVVEIAKIAGDEQTETGGEMLVKIDFTDTENPEFYFETTADVGYGEMTVAALFVDWICYMSAYGEDVKVAFTEEQFEEQFSGIGDHLTATTALLDSEKFGSLNKTPNDDGTVTLSFTDLKEKVFDDNMITMFEDIPGLFVEYAELKDYSIDLTVDGNGNIKSIAVDLEAELDEGEESKSGFDISLLVTLSDVGTTVVEAPENTDDFSEADYSMVFYVPEY